MSKLTKEKWSLIYKVILAILTGIGGTIGLQAMVV
ncbi:hypothetical protein Bcop_1498 [Bacteroides coprosuis DSM 18011]|uniref:Smalltalk protein n=1 Tax=Bacteroides coprosuis DSM 18011 TaxID=679937 RepID=F3ZPV5_9BACE|nr:MULTISPECIES: smalltalk protein [Bacteroides]EGJ71692.1 hypothetical protein Bcop_1498 [Bacteroides coprosuis DSM 18011]HJD92131.1 smalltalk protein [Bacteroides coprosuis]